MRDVLNTGIMRPCPRCETPFEEDEDSCATCHLPLSDNWHSADVARRYAARVRAGRIVWFGTAAVYIAALVGVITVGSSLRDGIPRPSGRDSLSIVEFVVIALGGWATYGLPGRTLHHYPSTMLIRRGRPRWWKGGAATAVFVASAFLGFEGILRPTLEARGARAIVLSPEEAASAIDATVAASYVAVGLIVAWNLVAPVFGRQNLPRSQRKALMKAQERRYGGG